MNIRYLQELLSGMGEITLIGKYAEVDGVMCYVMGIVRNATTMKLLILQYDEYFQKYDEEVEAAEPWEHSANVESNRMMLQGSRKTGGANPFGAVGKVFIGEREYEIQGFEHRRLSIQDVEAVLILSKFLGHGWQPEGIDFQRLDMLFLTSLELEDDPTASSFFYENPVLRFVMRPDSKTYLVEQPMTLSVGSEHYEKLLFQDRVTGKEHWVQINRVYLWDTWPHMKNVFEDPKIQEQMTPEQIAKAKSDFEERLLEICPKGMFFPVIEYECEESISLQFYSRAYLDAPSVSRSSVMGFIVHPDQPTGILGQKLKASVIPEPVPMNTNSMEIELFQYFQTVTGRDIVLK